MIHFGCKTPPDTSKEGEREGEAVSLSGLSRRGKGKVYRSPMVMVHGDTDAIRCESQQTKDGADDHKTILKR